MKEKEPSERLTRIKGFFKELCLRFTADEEEDRGKLRAEAAALWMRWPRHLATTLSEFWSDGNGEDGAMRGLSAEVSPLMADVLKEATRFLMREAERKNLDSSLLWEESRFCRDIILSGKWRDYQLACQKHLDARFLMWPDMLADERHELPGDLQQAITNGESLFWKLIAMFEIEDPKQIATSMSGLLDPVIPPEHRSDAMPLSQGARKMGFTGNEKQKREKLKTAMDAGTVAYEQLGRQSFVFDKRRFKSSK